MIGQRIRKLRDAKGWSQAELGRRAGLTDQTVSNLETGKRGATEPLLSTVQALARALGVPLTDLTDEVEPEVAATS